MPADESQPKRDPERPFPQHAHPWVEWKSPRLYIHTAPRVFSHDELSDFLSSAREFSSGVSSHFAVVTDLSLLERGSVDAVIRRRYADHLQAVAEINKEHCVMSAVVVRNTFQRGLMTAVLWMAPPLPRVVVTDLGSAITHCETALATCST